MEAAYSQSSSTVNESLMYGMCEQPILDGLSVIFSFAIEFIYCFTHGAGYLCFYSHINSCVVHRKNFDSFTI